MYLLFWDSIIELWFTQNKGSFHNQHKHDTVVGEYYRNKGKFKNKVTIIMGLNYIRKRINIVSNG